MWRQVCDKAQANEGRADAQGSSPQAAGSVPWQMRDKTEAHQEAACSLRRQVWEAQSYVCQGLMHGHASEHK